MKKYPRPPFLLLGSCVFALVFIAFTVGQAAAYDAKKKKTTDCAGLKRLANTAKHNAEVACNKDACDSLAKFNKAMAEFNKAVKKCKKDWPDTDIYKHLLENHKQAKQSQTECEAKCFGGGKAASPAEGAPAAERTNKGKKNYIKVE